MFHVKLNADLIAKVTHDEQVDDLKLASAERFCDLLLAANRKINLVSRAGDVEGEIRRQLLLSVAILPRLPADRALRWVDVGSGGGFPAIPLAIFRPWDRFELIESVAKKAFFLERTLDGLDLRNAEVNNCRVEELIAKRASDAEQYDWMSVKAVSGWEENLSWASALLLVGGCLVTYKPTDPTEDDVRLATTHGFELIDSFSIGGVAHCITTRLIVIKKL